MILSPETWLGDPGIPTSGGKDNLLFINSKSPVLNVVHKDVKPNVELICIHSHDSLDIIDLPIPTPEFTTSSLFALT